MHAMHDAFTNLEVGWVEGTDMIARISAPQNRARLF
jgi:hypothetical protein